MKLSKVQRVMDLFKINGEQLSNYKVDQLDVNRLPNSQRNINHNPRETRVTILREVNGQPKVLPLSTGSVTKNRLTDDTVAVQVEFRYDNDSYQKLLLIK